MALDALKLRNVVQLLGILGGHLFHKSYNHQLNSSPAFHIALVVFAALQVHEAHTALVFLNEDPCTTFIVRTSILSVKD